MGYAALFIGELFILFLLSQKVTRALSLVCFRLTHSRKITVYFLALLFFPGTVIHELLHFLMASVLFVPTGTIDLFPRLEGETVKLGSVQIAVTDPLRRMLIGVAPFLGGVSLIILTLFLTYQHQLLSNPLYLTLTGYVLFEISNTMFSSQKDMEGTLELGIAVAVLAGVAYLLGARVPVSFFTSLFTPSVIQLFQLACLMLAVPLILDFIVLSLMQLVFGKAQ